MIDKHDLAERLRARLFPDGADFSDDEILTWTSGTKVRAWVQLAMSLEDQERKMKAGMGGILRALYKVITWRRSA